MLPTRNRRADRLRNRFASLPLAQDQAFGLHALDSRTIVFAWSIRLDSRRQDHLMPARYLLLEESRGVLGRTSDRRGGKILQLLRDIGQPDRLGDSGREPGGNLRRRFRGRDKAVPRN